MTFTQDGEWLVGTPVYMGLDEEVKKAIQCPHGVWKKFHERVRGPNVTVIERCGDCVATRVRYKEVRRVR